jgi:hypothetical protein
MRPMSEGALSRAPSLSRQHARSGCTSFLRRQHQSGDRCRLREAGARGGPDALFVSSDTFFTSPRVRLISLAARHALPATYPVREFVEAGGLMTYGTSLDEACRQEFELIINLQTTKLLTHGFADAAHNRRRSNRIMELLTAGQRGQWERCGAIAALGRHPFRELNRCGAPAVAAARNP